jgi:quercetin dioxygenase-like cupin family protein
MHHLTTTRALLTRRSLFSAGIIAATALAFAGIQPALAQTGTTSTSGAIMQVTQEWDKTFPKSDKVDHQTVPGPEQFFTGKVTITGQFQRPEPSRVGGAIVHFEPGARTAWHRHPAGQTLIVTEGVGWTQIEGGPKLEFHAGDILWCPAEHKHWHGATPHDAMTHVAIQESVNGTPVTWMEKVTDEQYLSPLGEPKE